MIWPIIQGDKTYKRNVLRRFHVGKKMHSCSLPPSETWVSFTFQLCPLMLWDIKAVILSQHKLYKATRPVFFWCLPLLGVQQHIKLPWQMLPEMYQGNGLSKISLISLVAKLQYIQCNWGFNEALS
jgi:hypothetical protein